MTHETQKKKSFGRMRTDEIVKYPVHHDIRRSSQFHGDFQVLNRPKSFYRSHFKQIPFHLYFSAPFQILAEKIFTSFSSQKWLIKS